MRDCFSHDNDCVRMNLPLFTETTHCASRIHCRTCREDSARGEQFRETLRLHHQMPGAGLFPCPFGVTLDTLPARVKVVHRQQFVARTDRWKEQGPKLWAELHARPAVYEGDHAAERAWLEKFARRIGCGDCQRHWRELMRKMPVDLSSPASYRRWTIDVHNAVNVRLGKPTVEPAEPAYSTSAAPPGSTHHATGIPNAVGA
jgi:hypothetical protein